MAPPLPLRPTEASLRPGVWGAPTLHGSGAQKGPEGPFARRLPSPDEGRAQRSIPGRGAPPEGRAAAGRSPSLRQPDTPGIRCASARRYGLVAYPADAVSIDRARRGQSPLSRVAIASIEIRRPRGNATLAGADRAGGGSGMWRA
jgi:hypothetical protein